MSFLSVKENWTRLMVRLVLPAIALLVSLSSQQATFAQYSAQIPGQQSSGQPRSGTAVVQVNVVGQDGDPLGQGAQVTISAQGDSGRTDMSGSNGMVRFAGLSRGSYVVTVRDLGYKDGYGSVEVPMSYGTYNTTVTLESLPSADETGKGMLLAPKAKAEYDKGVEAMGHQHYDEAQKHLEAAYKLAPGNPDVNDKLGELFLVTKNTEKAQQYLQNALSLDPDNEDALTDMGELRIGERDYPAAEKPLEQAVNVDPNNWFAHWLLGVAYLRGNENEKARVQAAAAIKSGKGSANDAEYLLGEALAKLGRTTDAIHALQLFVKGAPRNSYAPAANALIAKLQSGGTIDGTEDLAPPTPKANTPQTVTQ
ncbi:MAG TPA: tetratricopeptide repeat protein [Candidatus Acidoferrales bacterium]